MKTVLRGIILILMFAGWSVAALCVHVVRVPNPDDPTTSKFVVIPKARLGVNETYVDARGWIPADVSAHAELVRSILFAGKADLFKYLTDPKSKEDTQKQLGEELKSEKTPGHLNVPASTRVSISDADVRLFDCEFCY